MYTVEFWDKVSPINTVSAEAYLASNPEMKEVNVLLVKSGKRVTRVEDPDILRDVYKWMEKTDEEVRSLLEQEVNKPVEGVN